VAQAPGLKERVIEPRDDAARRTTQPNAMPWLPCHPRA